MLRALVLVLLLANGGFFAWSQGWLAPLLPPRADVREPERLAAQHRPDLVTVLTPKAASEAMAAVAAAASEPTATVCLEAGPFTDAGVAAAEEALSQNSVPDGSVSREAVATAFTWGVVMGRFPDRDTMRAKAEELRRLGVRHEELSGPPFLVPGLRLGNFSDKYGAEAALGNLAQKGVRTARVVQLPSGPVQQWLRAPRADAELQTRLRSLPNDKLGAGFRPCVVRSGAG
ncbi:MAG: hypothetical protein RJA10_3942 [Pseudomonadota bacterium]|jgi:hypothetical protein